VTVLLLAAALTSCGAGSTPGPTQDANLIYTSVAGTMVAQLNVQQTETAQALPPSPLPSPTAMDTFTPQPTLPALPSVTPFTINTPVSAVQPTTFNAGGTPGSTGAGCADSKFISETKPDDGTQFTKSENFTKTWSFLNTGTCTWVNNYAFGFQSGDRMGGKTIVISRSVDFVPVGQVKAFSVQLEAPNVAGHYIGYWQMRTPEGGSFGSRVWVDIVVK
jgi:hypothetical protein